MARTYLPADARCRQLERLVRQHPGATVGQLAQLSSLAFFSAHAYLRRLRREGRVDVVADAPGAHMRRGCLLRFYEPGKATAVREAA